MNIGEVTSGRRESRLVVPCSSHLMVEFNDMSPIKTVMACPTHQTNESIPMPRGSLVRGLSSVRRCGQ